jgi:electron transfer flavoprotein alpha/beta subunit
LYNNIRGFRPTTRAGYEPGDPKASAEAILKVVDAENPPLRLLLGNFACDCVKELYPKRLATWAEWETVSRAADGN